MSKALEPSPAPWPQSHSRKLNSFARCKYVTRNSQLGDGHFSVVKECVNVYTRERYAMKLVRKKTVAGKMWLIQREVALLRELSARIREVERGHSSSKDLFEGHHHVLQLFDFFETADNIVLVTQLCRHDDLYEKIIEAGSLDIATQVKPYTACLVSALEFLHVNGIIHRDIKAENILFRETTGTEIETPAKDCRYDVQAHDLILGDFGLAVKSDSPDTQRKECVGTISYVAPEIARCHKSDRLPPSEQAKLRAYDSAVDIWALGVLCYFMFTGYMPFDCETDDETWHCIKEGDFYRDEELQNNQDPAVQDFWRFVQLCFSVEPTDRPTAQAMKSHPFIRAYSDDSYLTSQEFPQKEPLRKSHSSASFRSLLPPSKTPTSSTFKFYDIDSHDLLQGNNSDSRNRDLEKVRETLKRTLSMTSLASENNYKTNSTFKLAPPPPNGTLMNGGFCQTPECRSNLTSPGISRNASSSDIPRTASTEIFEAPHLTRQGTLSEKNSSKSLHLMQKGLETAEPQRIKSTARFVLLQGDDEDEEM